MSPPEAGINQSVFMTGATGYIGGAVLERFLSLQNLSFTVLVRSADKAKKLENFGVKPVLGSLDDAHILEEQAAQADIIIEIAICDHFRAHQALLGGAKKRFESTGKKPIFINTSGTACITVDTQGLSAPEEVWDDMEPERLEALPYSTIHRPVDSMLTRADEEGYVDTYIILPSSVWGIAKGKLVDAGVANSLSLSLPLTVEASLDRGQGGVVGQGLNVWPHVEIHELADLYVVVFEAIQNPTRNPALGKGKTGYYYVASGEYRFYDVSKRVAEVLYELGRGSSPEPTPFTKEDFEKYPALTILGTSGRCVSNRAFAIGWKPTKTTEDMLASVKVETLKILKTGYSVQKKLESVIQHALEAHA